MVYTSTTQLDCNAAIGPIKFYLKFCLFYREAIEAFRYFRSTVNGEQQTVSDDIYFYLVAVVFCASRRRRDFLKRCISAVIYYLRSAGCSGI